ncbi:MAG TPA: winged helix-turn-helix transcriptional regulator [Sphingomicrobium sp.]|nr:winged helix-turn-helix transcriptional regulator [Sphingomicrobium sp.]
MSHHLVNGTMTMKLPGLRKWILCVLSHGAVMSTGLLETTTAKLAEVSGFSPSSVRTQLRRLERDGFIEVERRAKAELIIKVKAF